MEPTGRDSRPAHPGRPPDGFATDLGMLEDLIRAGGFWGQAPLWVPRTYTPPTPEVLKTVETGLRSLL
ncbi:hypothetical protein GCM10018785_29370 [Streptomyces longispororuber]|uniref:Uncharacterized protein n=1 Tax=Streptomyces longispororuber TaxID=68230 RepID=A0A918ZMV0_9ACTN|nr:hypothetical protein GCM10018785_29370 [Streptomyces longispororuber]